MTFSTITKNKNKTIGENSSNDLLELPQAIRLQRVPHWETNRRKAKDTSLLHSRRMKEHCILGQSILIPNYFSFSDLFDLFQSCKPFKPWWWVTKVPIQNFSLLSSKESISFTSIPLALSKTSRITNLRLSMGFTTQSSKKWRTIYDDGQSNKLHVNFDIFSDCLKINLLISQGEHYK